MSQDSKIILITGTSSGFGLVTAARLAADGHRVIATMRNLEKKTALLSEVNRRGGKLAHILPLDVTDKASIDAAIVEISEQYGYIDILVNNAGYGIGGFFEDLTEEEIRAQMDTNFFGVQNVIRAVLPLMRPRHQGKIINISSVAGFSTSPAFGAYNASKWALEGFSESLRYELKPFGIDILLINPGVYPTPIFYDNARAAKNATNSESPYYERSQALNNFVEERLKTCDKDPEDIAHLVGKLIDQKNPRFRNMPDMEAKVLFLLRKFLPFRIYSWMIQSALSQK